MTPPEALRLADELDHGVGTIDRVRHEAAAELRRLHAENEALREANEAFGKRQEWWNEKMFAIEQQREAAQQALAEQDDDLTAAWMAGAAEGRKRAEQAQPLTDKDILSAVGWERAEMYMKLLPNFPVDEAKQETLKNARAVEAAVLERMGVQR